MTPIDDSPLLFAGLAGLLLFGARGCSPLSGASITVNQPLYLMVPPARLD